MTSGDIFFSFQIQLSVGRPKERERAGKALQQVRLFRETKEAFVRAECRAQSKPIEDSGSSHLGKPLPSQALT